MKKKNIHFNPVDFVEFAGENGADAIIVREKGLTTFRLAAMPNRKFKKLLKKYIEKGIGVM